MATLFSVLAVAQLSLYYSWALPVNPLRSLNHLKATVEYDLDVQLSVSPTLINESSAMVRATWSGVKHPSKHDWIGVWLLPDRSSSIDPKNHAPTKFLKCKENDTYKDTGAGQLSFQLINMRGVYQLGLLTGDIDDHATLVAASETVSFANPSQPLQGHLALTHDYTKMKITWVSSATGPPNVQWGVESSEYEFHSQANSTTYTANDMCDSPAKDYGWIDPGMMHTAVMDNLRPSTMYYYKFGSDGDGGYSKEHTFVSPPVPGSDVTTTVLAYGDMGHGEIDMSKENKNYQQPSLNTTNRLMQEHGDFIMHIGDLSYAEGYGASWEEFFYQVGPLMTKYAYMVNPGNHESDSPNSDSIFQGDDSGGECNVPYIKKFLMPRQGPNTPWYNFTYGMIHVIMMSTEHDFNTSSEQFRDLVGFFEGVNRTKTKWLVFSGHRPMYVSTTPSTKPNSHAVVAKLLRDNIEPLLLKYKVDLALWGHDHSYQRTCPVSDGKCTDGAPVHVIIGMGGQELTKHLNPEKPEYFQFLDNEHYGYSKFSVSSNSLSFEYIRNVDGVAADKWTITK